MEHASNETGASHGSLRSYTIGFILSAILTVIPFAMIMSGDFTREVSILVAVLAGMIQIVVHLVCFLHMNTSSEGRWNLMALLFTVMVLVLLVGLSLWIMFSAENLMMSWL